MIYTVVWAYASVDFGEMKLILVFNALLFNDVWPGELQRSARWVTCLSEATI